MKNIITLFLSCFSTLACNRPSNFSECVLDRMKGQAKEVIGIAREACEIEFPFETIVTDKKMEISWISKTENTLGIMVSNNFSGYRITRIIAQFSKKNCESIGPWSESSYTLTRIFTFNPPETESTAFAGDASTYNCMRTTDVYGIRSKQF